MSINWEQLKSMCQTGAIGAYATALQRESTDGYINEMNPSLFATMANAEDHPTWEQAMNGPDAHGYWEAAKKEIASLEELNVWEEIDRQD
jgi:hypothetical protein